MSSPNACSLHAVLPACMMNQTLEATSSFLLCHPPQLISASAKAHSNLDTCSRAQPFVSAVTCNPDGEFRIMLSKKEDKGKFQHFQPTVSESEKRKRNRRAKTGDQCVSSETKEGNQSLHAECHP